MSIDPEIEKAIVYNALKCLYQEKFACAILHSLYSESNGKAVFSITSNNEVNETSSKIQNQGTSSWSFIDEEPPKLIVKPKVHDFSINVEGFLRSHYAKLPFPKFVVNLVRVPDQKRGNVESNSITPQMDFPEVELKFSIWNRWVDVSKEVLSYRSRTKKVKNGRIEIEDFTINEVSLKHGGYFILHIHSLESSETKTHLPSISSWKSNTITINSERTWAKRKRLQTGGNLNVQESKGVYYGEENKEEDNKFQSQNQSRSSEQEQEKKNRIFTPKSSSSSSTTTTALKAEEEEKNLIFQILESKWSSNFDNISEQTLENFTTNFSTPFSDLKMTGEHDMDDDYNEYYDENDENDENDEDYNEEDL